MYMAPTKLRRLPPPRVRALMPPGATYLGEDAFNYYYMNPPDTQLGGIMDTINKISKNIWRITPISLVMRAVAPKAEKAIYQKAAKYIVPAVIGGALAVTAGPAVWNVLAPKLSQAGSLIMKGVSTVGGLFKGSGSSGGETFGPPAPSAGGGIVDSAINAAKVAGTIGGKVMQLISMLPANKQAEAAQALSPQDIAYAEEYGRLPPGAQAYFDQLLQQSYQSPVAPGGPSGSADLYNPFAYQGGGETKQAGMLGEINPMMLAAIGLPVLFYMMSGKR